MKAAVYLGNRKVEVMEVPVPQIGDDEVLIRVKACGVCGTDIHIYQGAQGAAECVPPKILGHEFSGVVEKTGSAATQLRPGDRVVVDPNDLCGKCYYCRTGRGHFCENITGIGTTVNGGFAQYCAFRAKQAYKIPDSLSFEEASLAEPVSCCLHGIDLAGIKPGSVALVIGGGPIGLIMVQLAKSAGAAEVILSEPVESKRAVAESLGATLTVNPLEQDVRAVLDQKGIGNIDTVIECVGLKSTMSDAISLSGKCGTVVLFGLTDPDCEIPIKPFEVFKKEIKITASYINPYTMSRALKLLESGLINVKPIISDCIPLDDINRVFTDPEMRRNGKIIIKP